ncbi:MAG: hypothetical protein NC037_05140 [Bacteroides sp.]|nr:hypothetical protein [Bacillota bacterium]MCM1394096.1 hypothetical protein [[Eubacterium] siraeum]MCM1455891.1 hypothetical protein [Bacteroides sp.]
MARKHQEEVDIQEEPLTIDMADGEPLYESDAYGSPQPDYGSDVTVMKQVGIGGPVPIVAPKHNTIQLQPIVVPLAVVPYMTQDSNVLRTDNRQAGGYVPEEEESYREATEFDTAPRRRAKSAKKKRAVSYTRIFSLISFIITALFLVPFFLSYKEIAIGDMLIMEFNVIAFIQIWIDFGFNIQTDYVQLIYVIVMGLAGIQLILTLLGIIIGKYPKPIISILSFLTTGSFLGLLIYALIKKAFIAELEIGFLVLLSVSALNFILSIVFSILLNSKEDKEERRVRRGSEI